MKVGQFVASVLLLGALSLNTAQAFNLGQGVIDVVRGKKSDDAGKIKDTGQGGIDITRGKKSDAAKYLKDKGQGVIDIYRGKKSQQAQNIKGAVKQGLKDAGYFVDEHKEAIALAAVVATVGWAACATGCDVLITYGSASVKVGSIGGASAGALVGAAVGEETKNDSKGVGTSPRIDVLQEKRDKPLIQPDSIRWSFPTLLAIKSSSDSDFEKHAETLVDHLKSIIAKDAPWAAVIDIALSPSVADAPVWNPDLEVAKRLQVTLEQAIGSDAWNIQLVDPKAIKMPSKTPELKPPEIEHRVSAASITTKEKIDLLTGIIGSLSGIPAPEVERRMRNGLDNDLKTYEAKRSAPTKPHN